MTVDVPEAQHAQFTRDNAECVELYGEPPPPPMTEAEATQLYDAMTATTECLRNLGWTTPDPPSREATVAAILDTGFPSWDPYQHVDEAVASSVELREIEQDCPRPWESAVAGP
jgi:hypothetical protein